MANNASNVDEIKATMINMYEKITDVNSTREFLRKEMSRTDVVGISKASRFGKYEKQKCESCGKSIKDASGIYIERLNGKKEVNCYTCMKKYFTHRAMPEQSSDKGDYLGWGLSGLFEQTTSDESSYCSTSSEDIPDFDKRCLYSRHKILRKLRRRKPQAFQVNYLDMDPHEILKVEIEDPELRRVIRKARGIEDKDQNKYNNLKQIKENKKFAKEYDFYARRCFDFSNEIHLKEKYSSTKFDFLTGLIHYYQKFLKRHPEEHYPSVSELIIKSGHNICKDEEDVVARYYEVLYKKGGSKKLDESVSAHDTHTESKSKKGTNQSNYEKSKLLKLQTVIQPEDVIYAKRTGILHLNRKALKDVPNDVWSLNNGQVESKAGITNKLSNLRKSVSKYKPLIYLNLSYNKLTGIQPRGNCLDTLLQLYLNDNKIKELPHEFGNFKLLQILDLENNMLQNLPKSFGNLTSLKDLNLSRNCLIELPNSFGSLKRLKTMDLRWNKLIKLPDTIEDMESLRNLNVAFNKVSELPMDFCNLYNLVILDVSYNNIQKLPMLGDMQKLLLVNAMGNLIKEFPNFANSKSLCEIRLDGNRIRNLVTEHLLNCPVVQLTMSHNKIEDIPENIYQVETFVLLDFTYNRLSFLPISLARLKYLTCLRVEENHITNLSKESLRGGSKKIIGDLLCNLLSYEGANETITQAKEELKTLYIKGENITPINKNERLDAKEVARTQFFIRKRLELTTLKNEWLEIAEKYRVKKVDISKNKFRYLPAGLKVLSSSLTELIVRENNLKTIPDFIGRLPHLVLLDLSFNHLDNLPLSMTTCHLTKLICKRNLFTAIPKVVFMIQSLEYLDFSENMLKDIDVDGLRNLRKLYHFNISKNEIKKLPPELGYLVNIKQLDVTDNVFKHPGPQVLRGGTKVLMEYLKRHPCKP